MPRVSYATPTVSYQYPINTAGGPPSYYAALLSEIRRQNHLWGITLDDPVIEEPDDNREENVPWSPVADPEPAERELRLSHHWTPEMGAASRADGWRLRYPSGESLLVVAVGMVTDDEEAQRRMWENTGPAGRMARRLLRHYNPDLYDYLSERFDDE